MKTQLTGRSVVTVAFLAICGGFLLLWLALTGISAQAQSSELVYTDVPQDAWYHEYIASLQEKGIFEGTDCEEGFCPGDPLKRWQMAVWLVRILDGQDPALINESRFDDVNDDVSWAHFVDRLSDLEVTAGCKSEPLRYCPDRSVTRSQMATFLYRAFDLPDAESPAGFTDVSEESWAFNYINALAASKITAGCKSEPFSYCPSGSVTKAQMATFLYRALEWRAGQRDEKLADHNPNNIEDYDPNTFYTEENEVSHFVKKEFIDKYSPDHPWLLRAWNHTNRPDFEYRLWQSNVAAVTFLRTDEDGSARAEVLASRSAAVMELSEGHLKDYHFSTLVHEMAHVYTLSNGVAVRPGSIAIAHLYFDHLGMGLCPGRELYADAAMLLVPARFNHHMGYWSGCPHLPAEAPQEAVTVVESAFSGNMPDWLYDHFQLADGTLDYAAIWTSVKSLNEYNRVPVVYQLKDEFGGYCSGQEARDSAFGNLELSQPWRDGGCL